MHSAIPDARRDPVRRQTLVRNEVLHPPTKNDDDNISMDQKRLQHISCVDRVFLQFLSVSKRMIFVLDLAVRLPAGPSANGKIG